MKAEIDAKGCICCGLCADICPTLFHQQGREKASVKLREIPVKLREEAETAEEQCPTNVIRIRK